jgi:hypothetical protein
MIIANIHYYAAYHTCLLPTYTIMQHIASCSLTLYFIKLLVIHVFLDLCYIYVTKMASHRLKSHKSNIIFPSPPADPHFSTLAAVGQEAGLN